MSPEPRPVTVVIPAWNSGRWLPGCLEALAGQTLADFTIVVVDDGSTDGGTDGLERPGLEVVPLPDNRGFAAAVNAGIRASASPYVALLNADTVARPGWLAALVARLEESPDEVAAIGSRMLLMDDPDRIEDAGNTLSWYGSALKLGRGEPAAEHDERQEVFSVCAAAALFRREFFADVGLFDERFESYFEDLEIGLRGRLLGWRYLYEPRAEVLHVGHGSGLARSRYVALMTRNRLLTLLKAIPATLLVRHLRRLLFGQLYFFLAYRRPSASLAGYASALRHLPAIIAERRALLGRRTLSNDEIDRLLTRELGEPPLRALVARKLGRRARTADGTGA